MYSDPKRVRKHRGTINLDDYEQAIIDALVNCTGMPQAELFHTLVMNEAMELLLATPMVETRAG